MLLKFITFLKIIFFILTIIIGIFFLRGNYIISDKNAFDMVGQILMPGYLVLCGVIIGYLISDIIILNYEQIDEYGKIKIYTKFFLIGIVIGIVFSLFYLF